MAMYYEAAARFDQDKAPLLKLVNEGHDLTRKDRDGMTLLHHACFEGHGEAAKILVDAGVPLEVQDRNGRTPLHLACMMAGKSSRGSDHIQIAAYLQQSGAAAVTQDKYGHTPLSYMPQAAKRVGLDVPVNSGYSAMWAMGKVSVDSSVLKGSVAQAVKVHAEE
eukprot:5336752-Pleurochrysis_carterae.AAC.1